MKFKQKMFALYCFSMLVFGILLLSIGLFQFENGMYKETNNSLKSSALAAMNLYNSQGVRGLWFKSGRKCLEGHEL